MAPPRGIKEKKGNSFKKEPDDPEINEIAQKLKEKYKEYATEAAAKKLTVSPPNFYINRAGQKVYVANAPIIKNNNPITLPTNCEDVESIKGQFAWKVFAGYYIPYIIRVINGEHLMFVSVRMAETQLLSDYLHCLNVDLYISCTSVKSYFITNSEAKLLNEINKKHVDSLYGSKIFIARKDFIVRLEDACEFHKFIELCYKKLIRNERDEKCGFIRINSSSFIPYCTKDGKKYVPLFYLEGDTESLRNRAIQISNWDLAYLKFCCKIQGIRDELYASSSCTVVNLDDIKNSYPPETIFEEYWPPRVIDSPPSLTNQSPNLNPSGIWTIAPRPTQSNISRTSTALVNVVRPLRPTMSQGSNLINSVGHVAPPGNIAPFIGQRMTNMNNSMITNVVISHVNQMPRLYIEHVDINSQMRQIRPRQQNQRQQQTTRIRNERIWHGRVTNTQQRNGLRNFRSIPTPNASEIIDLSSPPSSPVPPTVQEDSLNSNFGFKLIKIPERTFTDDTSINAAYKIEDAFFQGKTIHCINSKPYINSDFMVTLVDLVQILMPFCTVSRCANILNRNLKTTLFSGNSEQLALLRENKGRLGSLYTDGTPMVLLNDLTRVFDQLKTLLCDSNENVQQHQSVAGPSKRQHNS